MTKIDPVIEALYGPPPSGMDLSASTTLTYNIVTCVVLGLATACVALRFYVRTVYNTEMRNLGIDDYTIFISLFVTGALVATTLIAGRYGAGKHLWASTIDGLMTTLKVVFAEPWVYAASVTTTKISILLLYRRLFWVGDHKSIGSDLVFVAMFWTATICTCIFPFMMWITMTCACRPVSFYWRQYAGDTDGVCINVLAFYLAIGFINMVIDIMILAVPIPRIMRLQMNTKKKASITGIMLLGSFVCVASIFRIYYLQRLTVVTDLTWTLGPAFGWSSLEPSVAIISACLPTFAPLFRGLRNKGSNNSAQDRTGGSAHVRLQEYSQGTTGYLHGQSQFRIEDDEIQLTDKNNFRHTQSRDSISEQSSDMGHGIIVKTQVNVVTTET